MKSALLVAEQHILSGGLLRFFRVAESLKQQGISLTFTSIHPVADPTALTLPYVSWAEIKRQQWDFTMLPGAGFTAEGIKQLRNLKSKQFGCRVQHILNDQTLAEAFLTVNKVFQPDLVITNNHHWQPQRVKGFRAKRFDVLVGGVDCNLYQGITRLPFSQRQTITVGGQAHKNAAPLIAAVLSLPEHYRLNLMGKQLPNSNDSQTLYQQGRLTLTPCQTNDQLRAFHASCDVIVSTELFAGWANIVAEAMAAGSAVISTPCGTLDLVLNGTTGLVMDNPKPREIADRLRSLERWPTTSDKMIETAKQHVQQFAWAPYGERMAQLLLAT